MLQRQIPPPTMVLRTWAKSAKRQAAAETGYEYTVIQQEVKGIYVAPHAPPIFGQIIEAQELPS